MAYYRINREAVSTLTTPGHIYFIQAESSGLVKIGWATCPKTRMAQMQAHGPLKLLLLHSEPGNGREEAELHRQFTADRQHGEWFAPCSALMAEIDDRRSRNATKAYSPGEPAPTWSEPIFKIKPKRRRAPKSERTGPPWPPPQSYWQHGSPGWNRLVRAAAALG